MKKIKLPISGVSANSSITASSIENEARAASYVFDNNTQTRWSSRFSDPQWLEMDLGEIKDMVGMTLYWETAYGKSYDISISPDKKEWSKVYSTTEGDGEIDDIYFGRKKARYIKILCKERATQWGYSLWEIRIKDLNDEILVKASSSEGANVAANAMDGNRETLWHSGKNDAALIELETKKKKNIGGIFLNWGEDYATAYYIDVSSNGKNWTTVYKRIGGTGGLDKIYVNIMGKPYIRIRCENSDKGKGYAMKEIDLKDWEDIAKHSSLDKARGLAGWESCRWKTFVGKDGSFAAQPYPFQVTFWAYDYSTEKLYTPETIKTSWRLMEGGFPVTIVSWNSNDIERVMKKESLPHMPAFADYWPKEMRIVDGEHRILGDAQMAWAHRPALFPGQNMGITIPLEFFANSYKQYWQRAGKFSGYDGGWFVEYEKVFWGYNLKLAHPLIYLGMNDVALKNIRWSIEH